MPNLKFFKKKEEETQDASAIGDGLTLAQKAGLIFALSGREDVISWEILSQSQNATWTIRYYSDDSIMSVSAGDVLCFPHLEVFAAEVAGTTENAKVPPIIDNFFGAIASYDH